MAKGGRWILQLAAACGLGGAALFALISCNTPFIPIPPPSDPTFAPLLVVDPVMGGSRTVWETRGGPNEATSAAKIFIFNRDVGAGVITRAGNDGAYVASPLDGHANDRVDIQYEKPSGERSAVICRLLQEGLARTACPD
jgi:hypothetical protein